MNLILLGAPGAGKGTQAELLSKKLDIPTISTGNCLREAVASGTELGRKAKSFMDAGSLVPNEVVNGIVKDRLAQDDCKNGFILDGFPRTIPQAEYLETMGVKIDHVIDLEVPDEIIEPRMTGRRVCEKCGAPYHISRYTALVCEKCGGTLVLRADDKPETVRDRLKVYHDQTEPLKAYYEKTGKLCIIDGQKEIAQITEQILTAVEAH